jgi:hypothetical protein
MARHLVRQSQTWLRHDETVASMNIADHISLGDVDRALREAEHLRELLHRERAAREALAAALDLVTHEFKLDERYGTCWCACSRNAPNHQRATDVIGRTT